MLDLLTMPLSLVDRFKYVQAPVPGETAGPPQPLNDGRKTLVQLLIKWCMSLIQANAGVMLTEDEWKALDPADFNVFVLRTRVDDSHSVTRSEWWDGWIDSLQSRYST